MRDELQRTPTFSRHGQAGDDPERARSGLELLSRLAGPLLTADDPQVALQRACEEVREFLHCAVFFSFLLDERTGRLKLNVCGGVEADFARVVEGLELSESLCGVAFRDRRPVVVGQRDVEHDPRAELLRRIGVRAYACEPVLGPGGIAFGTLSFGARDRLSFSADDLALIRVLADFVAITQFRRRAEETLRSGEARFRALVQASSDVVYRMSADGREVQYIDGGGFVADTALPSRLWLEQYVPAEDQPRVAVVVEEALRSGSILELEHRVKLADGGIGWVFSRAIPIRDSHGAIVEWFGMSADISARKRAQDTLAATAERLALAASGGRIGIFEWDFAANKTWWTEQHARLLGLGDQSTPPPATLPVVTTAEYAYRDWADRVHPEDLPRVEAEIRRCGVERVPYQAEYRVIWPDGSVHWLVGRGLYQYDAAGVPRRMLGIIMDISDRKRAEQALNEINSTLERRVSERTAELRRSERRSATILEAALDAIIMIDGAGSVVACNPEAERMFGYAAAEVAGRSVHVLMPPDRGTDIIEYARSRQQKGAGGTDGLDGELTGRRRDGTEFPVRVSVGEVSDLGLHVCIARDVTEQRALQQEILQISMLEQRRIGQELHDGPLQGLTGIGLLAENLREALGREASPHQASAARLASEVAAVNREVRSLAQGLVPFEIHAAALGDAIGALAQTTTRRHGLRCDFECVGSVHDDAVAGHLYRITQEAVANAVKHARAGSVRIRLEADADAVRLEIRDDGAGMPGEGHATGGLGLRIMRYRCALMGGTLSVGPHEDGGTRIACLVPLREPPAA